MLAQLTRPKQNISLSEKMKKQEGKNYSQWARENAEYYYSRVEFYDKRYDDLFKAAEGILNEDDYGYITRPFADDQPDKGYPARLFNYGAIIPTNVDLLLGEFRQRRPKKHIYSKSPHKGVEKKHAEDAFRMQVLKQMYLSELVKQGIDIDGIEPEQIDLAIEMEKFNRTWDSEQVAEASHVLGALDQDISLPNKWADGFYHWLVANRVFTYKDIWNGDVVEEIVDPREIGYIASPNTEFLEDGEAVVRKVRMTRSKVVEKFWDVLTEEDITKIDESVGGSPLITSESGRFVQEPRLGLGEDRANDDKDKINDTATLDFINVVHVTWKSLRKVGAIASVDPMTGQPTTEWVDEGYKPAPGEKIEWKWVDQWWEAYIIDEDIYPAELMRPIPYQRLKLDNPSSPKGLYNGKINRGLSVVEKLTPYEHLFNYTMYLMNKALGKNKDKWMLMPQSLIPDNEDMNMFDFLYYIDAHGIGFFDDSDPKALQALQYMKVYDMDFGKFIAQFISLMEAIKQQARDRIGITPQRMGDIKSSAGKATTEEAIFRSYNVSEDLFASFLEFIETEYQGLYDLSKYAWIGGKRGSYMKNGNQLVEYMIRPESHQAADMGIYVVVDSSEDKKIEQIKAQALTFAQNDQSPATIAEILNSENYGELLDMLRDLEVKAEQMAQQQMQAAQQAEQAKDQLKMAELQQQAQLAQMEDQHESYENALDRQLKLIEINSNNLAGQAPGDADVQKTFIEANKLGLEQQKVNLTREQMRSNEKIAKDKNDTDLKKEKIKAKTALKNKVVGEK